MRLPVPLTLREISRISRALVATHHADRLHVDGVAHAESGSGYAEVLMTVRPAGPSDRRAPRTLLVQVHRLDQATLENDLRRRIARALKPRPVA